MQEIAPQPHHHAEVDHGEEDSDRDHKVVAHHRVIEKLAYPGIAERDFDESERYATGTKIAVNLPEESLGTPA